MSLSLYVCNSSSRTICFLFLYGPQFGNDCMFEMVERKIKSICDMRILHKIQISVSPNKVLSEHKHTHSGPCCLELLSKHSSRVEELCRRAAGPLSHRYLVFGPLQKRSAESSFILYAQDGNAEAQCVHFLLHLFSKVALPMLTPITSV